MVDCGSPRCAQERRSFRRDLQCWSKKVPLVLGLERIAADYVDKETAKKLLNPYPEWEQEATHDFEPSKRCFHCEKKLPNVYKRIQRIIDDAKKGKENNGKICLRSLQDLMPFSLDFYTHGFGRELFSDVVKTYFLTLVQQSEVKEEPEPQAQVSTSTENLEKLKIPHLTIGRSSKKQDPNRQGYTEEDLDSAVSDIRSGKLGTRRAAMIYGIPRSTLRNKMVKTEPEEVLIAEDEDEAHMTDLDLYESVRMHHLSHMNLPETSMGLKMSDLDIFGLGQSVAHHRSMSLLPPLSYPVSIKLKQDDHDLMIEQRLAQVRRMHNLDGLSEARPRPAHANHLKLPLLVDVVRKLVHQKFVEIKQNYGKKGNSFESKSKHNQEAELYSPFTPYLPFSSCAPTSHNDENVTAPMYKHIMESIYSNMMKEESPIPKPFGKVNECSRIGDTLKDIIAKTISEKMRFRDASSDESSLPTSPDGQKNIVGKFLERNPFSLGSQVQQNSKTTNSGCSPPKRAKKESSKLTTHTTNSGSDSGCPPPKKTRPKRGQYRKYNSQLLMDAVKAVQRGEMSVHRAGSYFGVPHSTLEYKVKERHLLRQKKARDSNSPCPGPKSDGPSTTIQALERDLSPHEGDVYSTSKKLNGSSSARSSTSSSSSPPPPTILCLSKTPPASTSKSLLPPSSPSSPLPLASSALDVTPSKDVRSLTWFQPYLSTPSPKLDSTIGLIPSSLSLNNSASELLRKLQHKVQAKGSSFPADSAFELPCGKERVFDLNQPTSSGSSLSERLALYNQSV